MFSPGSADARHPRFLWLLPVAAAAMTFANTLPGDFLPGERVFSASTAAPAAPSPVLILESYQSIERPDVGFRPVTYFTYAVNALLGKGAWGFHLVNVVLHVMTAAAAHFLLHALLGNAALACLGASLWAVLPIQADAVASIGGRAEILAGMGVFAAWLAALHAPRPGASPAERPLFVLGTGGATFFALHASEGVGFSVPVLILAGSWLLRRPVPRLALAAALCAAAGHLALRGALLEGQPGLITPVDNPLAIEGFLSRLLNGIILAGRYAMKGLAPVDLRADYAGAEVPIATPGSAAAWLEALGVLVLLGAAGAAALRRIPLVTLAVIHFAATMLPYASILLPAPKAFAERHAYIASLAGPLAISATVQVLPGQARRAGMALIALLIMASSTMTFLRNRDWASEERLFASLRRTSPERLKSIFKALSESRVGGVAQAARNRLLEDALMEARAAVAANPDDAWAHAIWGRALYQEGNYAKALERLEKAAKFLVAGSPPQSDPTLHLLLGTVKLFLGTDRNTLAEALEHLNQHVRLAEAAGQKVEWVALSRRGQVNGRLGKLPEAMKDFDAAVEARKGIEILNSDVAQLWNNRGYCRFQLGDLPGAIEDYSRGLQVCRALNIPHAATGDSIWAFHKRLADVHRAVEAQKRKAGDEAGAQEAAAAAAKHDAEGQALAPKKP